MWWMVSAALAQSTCSATSMANLSETVPPAVIVLGERKGTQPDLHRALRLARKLSARGPVTLALQAVRSEQQPTLDAFAAGSITPETLPEELQFAQTWGFSWDAYAPLVTASLEGITVLGAGVPFSPRPTNAVLPLPSGYIQVLADAMGESPIPVEMEPQFVQSVAWMDHRIAAAALNGWSGQGTLIILADRLHVEGGKGVSWQAQRLTDTPVTAALLSWGDTPCYPGDLLLP